MVLGMPTTINLTPRMIGCEISADCRRLMHRTELVGEERLS
jgi:hypothetical protein